MRDKFIDRLTIGGVIFLTLTAFVLSYDNLRQLAVTAGFNWWLSWLFPFCLDSIMLVAAVATLRATIRGDGTIYAWWLIIAFTGLSVAGNMLHLPTSESWYVDGIKPWLPYAVFSIPPVALALSFHLLIVSIHNDIRRGMTQINVTPPSMVVADDTPIVSLPDTVDTIDTPPMSAIVTIDKKTQALQLKAEGLTAAQIAGELAVSKETVYRWQRNGK